MQKYKLLVISHCRSNETFVFFSEMNNIYATVCESVDYRQAIANPCLSPYRKAACKGKGEVSFMMR
jgi:hypothetical protein